MNAKLAVRRFLLIGLLCALPAFVQTAHAGGWRFGFGFSPFWYPGWGFYDPGYPYGYYPDGPYYPDQRGSDRNATANIEAQVQAALARRGYYEGRVDGVVGSGTRSAIRQFQYDNGLPVTGQIDSQLVQALRIGRD
jgi:hypothetical protein